MRNHPLFYELIPIIKGGQQHAKMVGIHQKNQPSDNDIMMIEDKDANVNKLLTFLDCQTGLLKN